MKCSINQKGKNPTLTNVRRQINQIKIVIYSRVITTKEKEYHRDEYKTEWHCHLRLRDQGRPH
jgi:hypothetical protein